MPFMLMVQGPKSSHLCNMRIIENNRYLIQIQNIIYWEKKSRPIVSLQFMSFKKAHFKIKNRNLLKMLQKHSKKFDTDKSLSLLKYFMRKKNIFVSALCLWPLKIDEYGDENYTNILWIGIWTYTLQYFMRKKSSKGHPIPSQPSAPCQAKRLHQSNCNNWLKGVVFKGSYFSEDSCPVSSKSLLKIIFLC